METAKIAACSEDFLCREDIDAVLAVFHFYGYGENASEAVEKIDTDEKDYHKHFLRVKVCITTAYHINSSKRGCLY